MMRLNVSNDLEALINKRLSSGNYSSAEDVVRRALEAQEDAIEADAEDSWTDEERSAISAFIEDRYQQAESGEVIDGEQARLQIQEMKAIWRSSRR
jgi:Arc/MetJ-type ribon-helix-helix transcriptional regulator